MGSVLSILAGFCVLYLYYANRSNGSASADITHDRNTDDTEFDKDNPSGASDQLATQGHKTTRTIQRAASFFHAASHVDASHGIFSDVGGDQHISITTNIDPNPEHREFGDWASPLNFKLIQSEIFQTRQAGTGKWLLESKEFTEWRDGQSETLWCRGIPGSGKTVLASIIISYLLASFKDRNVAILYIYCNYKEQTVQTVPNLVASLLKQLVQDHHAAYDNVKSFYKQHQDQRTRPTLDEFRTVIRTEAEKFSKVFVVVDALDECSEVDGTRANLLIALRSLANNVNLLVTSRDLPSIAHDFRGTKRLDIHANDEDVRKYIEGRIPREPRLAMHVKGSQTLQEEIVKTIIRNVRGMFLLARLHIDSLATAISRLKVREALRYLPQEVSDTYDEAMKRIEGQVEGDRKLAERVFSWITYAYRQLSLEELRHALAVSPGMTRMEPDALVDDTILTSVCAGLVVVDQESNAVRLVHYTTQEYFENIRASRFPYAQVDITETCITYLSFDVFRRDYCHEEEELKSFLESNPLLEYAARYWGHHARGQAEESMQVRQFLQDYLHFLCVNQVLHVGPHCLFFDCFPRYFFGIHVSSYFGLAQTIEYQLQNGAHADAKDSHNCTPLSWAAGEGHEAVVKLLLARDHVDVNSEGNSGQTPLSRAAREGHEPVVKLLLAREDVDVNSKDDSGRTALSLVATRGHEAVAKLLLVRDDADVNSTDDSDQMPLSRAAKEGHEPVVKLLLAREDVDVNSKDDEGRTALSLAAKSGHEAVAKLLLVRYDADVNSKDNSDQTPLSHAAEEGHEPVVKLLLAREDVDVNAHEDFGETPLSLAANEGHEAVVDLLLARGDVEVNSLDSVGQTPLSQAAKEGHEQVVKLLLAREDVDVNSKDNSGRTALSLAAEGWHKAAMKFLFTRHALDVTSKDWSGQMRLFLAAKGGHEAVTKLLLARDDVDVNSEDEYGGTPLSLAAETGHGAAVELLLARDDIDVNLKNSEGNTPLSLAARNEEKAVVNLLLARDDVDVDPKGDHGKTQLSLAVMAGQEEVMKFLLERDDIDVNSMHMRSLLSLAAKHGFEAVVELLLTRDDVDVNSKDYEGNTPLSWAVMARQEEVIKLLLECVDVDVNSKNYDGKTSLSLAAEGGHEAVTKLLLARDDVDVNSHEYFDETPLSLAAKKGHEAVVKLLLAWGDVDVNSKDHYGRTPLSLAAQNGHEATVKLLLARDDVDVNSKHRHGQTPLSVAAENGHEAVVKLLLARDDVDVNLPDHYGHTPLSQTFLIRRTAIAKLLLARGAVQISSALEGLGT